MNQPSIVLTLASLALVPYALLEIRFRRNLASAPETLGLSAKGGAGWKRLVRRRIIAALMGAIFWMASATAASGALRLPRYVSQKVVGAEIVFVLDVSNSMLSQDGKERRLDAATAMVRRLAASTEGAGLSLVAFRGRPTTLCPSTRDRRAFDEALRWAGPAVTSAAGSDVGAAIDEALRPSFKEGTTRVVVVLSDGNDTGGGARAAARRAASSGALLAFIGFGGSQKAAVFNLDGRPVIGSGGRQAETSRDESAMRDWAAAGRAVYVGADDAGGFGTVAALAAGAAGESGKRRDVRVEVDAAPAMAAIALVSLLAAILLSGAPLGSKRGVLPLAVSLLAALFVSCGPPDAVELARANRLYRGGYVHEAAALYLKAGAGKEPIASYNLGNVFTLLGEKAPARAMFDAAIQGADEALAARTALAARAWYNRGVAEYADGAYKAAAASFRTALEAYSAARAGQGLDRILARAYELALKADAEARNASAKERAGYNSAQVPGASQSFSLSRSDEKTLFMPGDGARGSVEDH